VIAFHLDHEAHAVAARFVTDITDAFDLFLFHQIHNAFDQQSLGDLIRNRADYDEFLFVVVGLQIGLTAIEDATTARFKIVSDPIGTQDKTSRGEIRTFDVLTQVQRLQLGIVDQGDHGIANLADVVGRDIGGHAHRDTG